MLLSPGDRWINPDSVSMTAPNPAGTWASTYTGGSIGTVSIARPDGQTVVRVRSVSGGGQQNWARLTFATGQPLFSGGTVTVRFWCDLGGADSVGGALQFAEMPDFSTGTLEAIVSIRHGWNTLRVHKGTLNPTGSASLSWNSFRAIEIRSFAIAGTVQTLVVDRIERGRYAKPKIVLAEDDAHVSVFQEMFPRCRAFDIPVTHGVIGSRSNNPEHCSLAMLRQMRAAGDSMANHTWSHLANSINQPGAESLIRTEIGNCTRWLEDNGLGGDGGPLHLWTPYHEWTPTLQQIATEELGILSVRAGDHNSVATRPNRPCEALESRWPKRTWGCFLADSGHSAATVLHFVDAMIAAGRNGVVLFHRFAAVPTLSTEFSTAELQRVVEGLHRRRNLVDFATWPQLFAGMG
ncbi:MAG: polysaccharide deacetylase family protein [Fimbriimonadaceae bacterium]